LIIGILPEVAFGFFDKSYWLLGLEIIFQIELIETLKKQIQQKISGSSLLKGLVIMGSGTAISQVLKIIFVPILTRIYPPSIYGTLAVFSSLLLLLIVGSSLKYELAIPLPEKDNDAEYLLILSFSIVCIFTIVLFLILMFTGDFLAGVFHFEFIAPYYWLFCFGFFGSSVYQILTYWTIRSKDYVSITRTKITQSISGSVSKIILGLLSLGSFGLICGEIIGRMVGIGSLGKPIFPKIWLTIHDLDFHKLKSMAHRYRKFPIFSLPAGFINELSLQAPILFLASMFGFETAGLFSLSYAMLVLPVSLITSSMGQVYAAECSELFRRKSGDILALYLNITKKLFMFGAPIILLGAFISPFLFPLIFGNAWKEAGIFVLPLSILVIAQFVFSPTSRLDIFGYNHWDLILNISRTFLVIVGFYLAIQFKLSPIATILVFSLTMTTMYIVDFMFNIKAIKQMMKKMM
jgi:O-antigen/teichoic acid export membrane protein